MGDKIEYLIKNRGLTTTSFAKMLDVQPSGISHIISGRNKPSFDLVVKILKLFPEVNPDWLLLDDERIFRNGANPSSTPSASPAFGDVPGDTLFSQPRDIAVSEDNVAEKNVALESFSIPPARGKAIDRIIVLYSDKSFDSYSPSSH